MTKRGTRVKRKVKHRATRKMMGGTITIEYVLSCVNDILKCHDVNRATCLGIYTKLLIVNKYLLNNKNDEFINKIDISEFKDKLQSLQKNENLSIIARDISKEIYNQLDTSQPPYGYQYSSAVTPSPPPSPASLAASDSGGVSLYP